MRITKLGWVLIAMLVATGVLAIFVPTAGLIAALVLAVALLVVLSEGFLGAGSQAHETWSRVDADRKRDALRR